MWSERRRLLALAGAGLGLAACGFEPLYDPAGPAAALAGRIEVDVIPGSAGYAMRERLIERLGPAEAPTHRLAVDLRLTQVGVAITERDVTTRFDVAAVAEWRLYDRAVSGAVMAETERAVTGYSAPSSATASEFAILSARQDAENRLTTLLADRIAQRVALAAAGGGP